MIKRHNVDDSGHRQKQFTAIDNEAREEMWQLVRKRKLHSTDVAIHELLLSKPDMWHANKSWVVKETKLNHSTVLASFRRLEEWGYLRQIDGGRGPDGRKKMDLYDIYEKSSQQPLINNGGGKTTAAKRQPKRVLQKMANNNTDVIYNDDNNTELYSVVEQKSEKEYEWSQYPNLIDTIVAEHGLQEEVRRARKQYKPEIIDEKLLYFAAVAKNKIINKPDHYLCKALAEDWTDGKEGERANGAAYKEEELHLIQRQRGLPP